MFAMDESVWFGPNPKDDLAATENAASSMAALVGRILGAKPFPEAARKLADLTRNPNCRIDPIVKVLEGDPGLSARLLRLVNSAGYSLRVRCTSVRHAAALVGTERLNQVATTAAVLDMFAAEGELAGAILEHSTIVGAFCRYLAVHLSLPADDLFTCGFLHDIGKLMLLEAEGDRYAELLHAHPCAGDRLPGLERELLGFDHALLAGHVLRAWNIPDPVPRVVAAHHHPAGSYEASSLITAMINVLRLADQLADAFEKGGEAATPAAIASGEPAGFLEISEPQLAAMWSELRGVYARCQESMGKEATVVAMATSSIRPSLPAAKRTPTAPPSELPSQLACVVCHGPSFGNTCAACHGHVCPNDQLGDEGWCLECVQAYRELTASSSLPTPVRVVATFMAAALVLALTTLAQVAWGSSPLPAALGSVLLVAVLIVAAVIGRSAWLRSRFLQSRPDRFRPAAPPSLEDLSSPGSAQQVFSEAMLQSMPPGRVLFSTVPAPGEGGPPDGELPTSIFINDPETALASGIQAVSLAPDAGAVAARVAPAAAAPEPSRPVSEPTAPASELMAESLELLARTIGSENGAAANLVHAAPPEAQPVAAAVAAPAPSAAVGTAPPADPAPKDAALGDPAQLKMIEAVAAAVAERVALRVAQQFADLMREQAAPKPKPRKKRAVKPATKRPRRSAASKATS